MKKKFQLGKDALTLSITTLITVLVWIGFDVYRALTKSQIPRILQKQIAPLNPKISTQTLTKLETRISFSQAELSEVTAPVVEEELTEEVEETEEEMTTEGGEVATESGILE